MFDAFRRNFSVDVSGLPDNEVSASVPAVTGLRELLNAFGGASFCGGLYRVIRPTDLCQWKERIGLAFPEFESRIVCFGYDWLGTTFALDFERLENSQPGVIMFEPGSGEALEIPANVCTFHNTALMEFGEAALAMSFYQKWRDSGGAAPAYDQCIGYRHPLFLGGGDEVENLEVSDLDVYWHIAGQLITRARHLPEGTRVRPKMSE